MKIAPLAAVLIVLAFAVLTVSLTGCGGSPTTDVPDTKYPVLIVQRSLNGTTGWVVVPHVHGIAKVTEGEYYRVSSDSKNTTSAWSEGAQDGGTYTPSAAVPAIGTIMYTFVVTEGGRIYNLGVLVMTFPVMGN